MNLKPPNDEPETDVWPDEAEAESVMMLFADLFPDLIRFRRCPELNCNGYDKIVPVPVIFGEQVAKVHLRPLLYLIVHLNDHHKWTREQIADWVESQDLDLRFEVNDGR